MKKSIIKGIVFGLTFFVAVVIISKVMNQENQNMTVEMAPAVYPVVCMGINGTLYNELHGYAQIMDTAYMRDTVTVLDEGRSTEFTIRTFGTPVSGMSYEVRSVDGERLIENTEVTDLDKKSDVIKGKITVKDLIEKESEYELVLVLKLEDGENIRYYTRVLWAPDYHLGEKLDFAMSFHDKTFDKKRVQDLAKYMETNSMGDNSSLHNVNIHCSLGQLSWGNLSVTQVTEPVFAVTELGAQTASLAGSYIVSAKNGNDTCYFFVKECYRIRYTADRTYLLDYNRTMNTILDAKSDIYVNDKIMLGVEDESLPIVESEDGNVFAFVVQNRLYSYNITTNKMSVVFGFYDRENGDSRTLYDQHGIRILNIDEAGNIQFMVYGYMNRGRHEGEVGLQVYYYDSTLNTIEEALYIPYDKTYQILKAEVDQLLYLNRENYLYLTLENVVYEIDLAEKTGSCILEIVQDDCMQVSATNKMAVWQRKGGLYDAKELVLMNLGTGEQITIEAGADEYIMPLGFMEEDLVYGLARKSDIMTDSAGRTTFPMYIVYIQDAQGKILKTYRQDGVYVSDCTMQGNQINLDRLLKLEDGTFAETTQDHIMNSNETVTGKNTIKTAITENYGKFIQIAVKKDIDAKSIQILTPKEVLYEGGRELALSKESQTGRYYVYGLEGVAGIYREPARAIQLAETESGVVINEAGGYVWSRGNRSSRNQIMAIEAATVTEEKNSLAVCLDTILKYEGITRNSALMLAQNETAYSILDTVLEDARILDLKGCSLDAMLYYVNKDIPVLASLHDGGAVLIVGFNEYNVVLMDPENGKLYKMGMNDATKWFEENGNSFISYIK